MAASVSQLLTFWLTKPATLLPGRSQASNMLKALKPIRYASGKPAQAGPLGTEAQDSVAAGARYCLGLSSVMVYCAQVEPSAKWWRSGWTAQYSVCKLSAGLFVWGTCGCCCAACGLDKQQHCMLCHR